MFIASFLCFYSCSTEEEIAPPEPTPTPTPTPDPTPIETQDSLYYSLEAPDFELVAATKDNVAAFMQRDTLFDFRCLFDSCQSNRLMAYCDSSGVVERICVEENVFDFLYHKDRSKLDILYKKDGKLDFIKDVENPFKDIDTRTESGDVPFSAIHALSRASYGIYTIINTCPLDFFHQHPYRYLYMKRYGAKPLKSKIALDIIVAIYEKQYGQLLGNYYAEIASVMKDYATWVRNELYGGAIPLARRYVERTGMGSATMYAFVNDVEEDKQDFQVGVIIQKNEKSLFSGMYNYGNISYDFNINKTYYAAEYRGMQTGKRYKFKAYLAPLSSSKYLDGVKCLIDYYRYGVAHTFDLLEARGRMISCRSDRATIELSAETIDRQKIKMGLYYSSNPELPKNEWKKVECDISFNDYAFSDVITKTVELEGLEPNTLYYYTPYIVYDANIVNRPLKKPTKNADITETITEKDLEFCSALETFTTKDIGTIRDLQKERATYMDGISWGIAPIVIFEYVATASIEGLGDDDWGIYYGFSKDEEYELVSLPKPQPADKESSIKETVPLAIPVFRDSFDEMDLNNYIASKKLYIGTYRSSTYGVEYSEPQEYTLVYDTPPSIYFTDFQIISSSFITPGEDGNDMQSDYYMSFNVHGALFISDIFQSFNGKQSLLGAVEVMDGSYSLQGSFLYSSSYEEPPATGYLRVGVTSNAKDYFSSNYIVLDWGSGSFYLAGKANSSTQKLGKHQKIEVENIIRHVGN